MIRQRIDGARAEGLDYWYRCDNQPIPYGALYTKYFPHVEELRVMVFCGNVFAAYRKIDKDDSWLFKPVRISKDLAEHARTAAKALDIDYIGFDVVVDENGSYAFLEANSGPILVEKMAEEIKKYLVAK